MIDALEAEKAVLGSILMDADAFYQTGELKAEDFFNTWNRGIYIGMFQVAMAGGTIDLVTLVTHLGNNKQLGKVGDAGYVSSLLDGIPENPRIESYVKIVIEASRRRALVNICKASIAQCEDMSETTNDCVSLAVDRVLNLAGNLGEQQSVRISDYSAGVYEQIQVLADTPMSDLPVGLPTGISGIDFRTTGIREGEFWIVASYAGEGKSQLIAQVIVTNTKKGVPVLWFTQEMTRKQVLLRLIPQLTDGAVKGHHLRDPRRMLAGTLEAFKQTKAVVDTWPLWVHDSSKIGSAQLYAHARAMVKREKIGLIAVDYIQLVKGRGESRYEQTTDVSNTLRELAKDTGVPVLAVSQLSKPERGEKRPPRIFDMKESGALEQDAHVILLPYRPQEKDGHYTHKDIIIIGKQREGPTGSIKAPFDSKTLTFQGEQEDATFEELF